ncbi:MAG: OB-fold nucleic acid binding domain-containing protein [Candidatus Nanoarchaeia archaeon]
MKDKTLLKIALLLSLPGLILIYIFSLNEVVPELSITSAEKDSVKVTGEIKNMKKAGNVTIFDLEYQDRIKVVIFEDVNLDTGRVKIKGVVEEYNGEKEIVAHKLEYVD